MTTPKDAIRLDPNRKTPRDAAAPQKQADGTPQPLHHAESPDPDDQHLGATEDDMSDTPAPAGSAFNDEPKQG